MVDRRAHPKYCRTAFSIPACWARSTSSGTWTATCLTSDDGSRSALGGQPLSDIWYDHGRVTATSSKGVTAGTHLLRVEFYEHTGLADISLAIAQTSQPPTAKISARTTGTQYFAGNAVNYAGTGTSATGQAIPGSGLTWRPVQRHCVSGWCHSHFLPTATGSTGSFAFLAHGLATGECYFDQLTLTARDPATGSTGTASVNLYSRTQPTCP